ncbi:uncharacterized protein ACNS7B_001154 [Menidia menidia]
MGAGAWVPVLLLSAVIVCGSSLASASANTTEGSGSETPQNSTGAQDRCHGDRLPAATHSVSGGVDELSGQLTCKRTANGNLSEEKSRRVEENLRKIVESTLEVLLDLSSNQSSLNVLEVFGVLDSLRLVNSSDPEAVRLWFSLKMAPLLRFVDRGFLIQLAQQNFSCSSFQELVKSMGVEQEKTPGREGKLIYVNFIKVFLSREDVADPGCVSSSSVSTEWIKINLGFFLSFASLQDLQALSPNFSIAETFSTLNISQIAQLIVSSGTLNNTGVIDLTFDKIEDGNALENVDEFLTQINANRQAPEFTPVVRDRIMNRTFNIVGPKFKDFDKEDFEIWFQVKLVPILASFRPQMLRNATSGINCTNYHVVVGGIVNVFPAIPANRLQGLTDALLDYLRQSASVINTPACRQGINSDAEWIQTNLGPFSTYTSYADLKAFNLSQETVIGVLSPQQRAELILDPDSGALEDADLVRAVLTNLTASGDERQITEFFQTFTEINKQNNITVITNTAVRDTILNLTLTALAPGFNSFEPRDFQLWFQVYLPPVIASFTLNYVGAIPENITCASYTEILTGLGKSLTFLTLDLSMDVRSSIESLKLTFPRCSVPDSFMCMETPVDENLICAGVNRSQIQQKLDADNSSTALCSITITEHACSSAMNLTQTHLASLLNCSLESQRTYPVEVWKLLFQKASPALDQALETFTTTASNNSNRALSNALEALGEVRFASFGQEQLQSQDFISNWFQRRIKPFLASSSTNFLFCLSSYNFSCQTYQTIIKAFSNQRGFMETNRQRTVYTHFIKPFLSRNDSSDPGCVSSVNGSQGWLQANLGGFSDFATLQDLKALNPNLSGTEILSELAPSQVAQLLLSSEKSNDTDLIDRVFDRLEDGNALENVDEFLTQINANGQAPEFTPVVRDRIMNRTFNIVGPKFKDFDKEDFEIWFQVKLVPILASFRPQMLRNATSGINCTNYHVVVGGIVNVFPAIPANRLQGLTDALLDYLRQSASVINTPACRQGINSDAEWIQTNLGPFSTYTSYADLKAFNLSQETVIGVLSPQQRAELILDPDSGALEDADLVRAVLTNLTASGDERQITQFFQTFTEINKQNNITVITNTAVRDTILNLTLTALAPGFNSFEPRDFQLWFQVYLPPVIASFTPNYVGAIPNNITCASYTEILTGLGESLTFLTLDLSMDVRSSIESLKLTFPRCSVPDSFMCMETPVDENLICAGVNRSQIQQKLDADNSSTALCSITITEHACSSGTNLTQTHLALLLNCSLESQRTYPVEVWKLLFQKASPALDQALETFTTTAANNNSNRALSNALEALGEVRFTSFGQEQLQSQDFISNWFQRRIKPFLASSSTNFLFCLSSYNFSCQTYQTIIKAFSNQRGFMETNRQRTVYTHFIKPFLSRNDSSDPGCVSSVNGSQGWLQANLGGFSDFATLQDLKDLNPNFSGTEILSELAPSQVAQLLLSSEKSNDTDLIDRVFDRLEDGNALENVDEFLTQINANGQAPEFTPVVRDRIMDRTFNIVGPKFKDFDKEDFEIWFQVKLVPILASFRPQMLRNATSGINCTNYHVVVGGIVNVFPAIPANRLQGLTDALLDYLRQSASVINTPACRQGINSDAEWIQINLGPFSPYISYADLKAFNLSQETVIGVLSPQQRAELILDPDSGALEDADLVRAVLTNLTASGDERQITQFFQTFTEINQQNNVTVITNTAVRDTILNLTLTTLAPGFNSFEPRDFQLWFQVYLPPVIASFTPNYVGAIPNNITCASYTEILTGLGQSLTFLTLDLSMDVRSSIESLKLTFPRCSVPDSFMCMETPVDENLICAGVNRSQIQQKLDADNSSTALCSITITEHACSSGTNLTQTHLASLLNCSLESQRTYPVEVWKLLFQKASPALDQALETFTTTASNNNSNRALSNALEALGEVRFASFGQEQLQSQDFISNWFQRRIKPFLASSSTNFLFCLSSYNFSCQTYQTIIKAFSNQRGFMETNRQRTVYTHFIKPFLSRNDSSDPGCVSSVNGSQGWLQANLGGFSDFATLQDLKDLNPNFSGTEILSELAPSQVAQLLLSSEKSNDTDLIDRVFDRLEDGNALENVDEFLTQINANGQAPEFTPVVRDRIMDRTFNIVGPKFKDFDKEDFEIWFQVKLVPILASFRPQMLRNATSGINCTNYHVVVGGIVNVFPAIPANRLQGLTDALLDYLRQSASVINTPACRQGINSDAEWIQINLGPFSPYISYADLKAFNLSQETVIGVLSPQQRAELILDPDSGALEDADLVRAVLTNLTASGDERQITQFFQTFTEINQQNNVTVITNTAVRDTILNLTLTALAPGFNSFEPRDFQLWFQVYLPPVIASFTPNYVIAIPENITCASYTEILTGLGQSLTFLTLDLSMDVRSSIESLKLTFPRCSVPDSFMCMETPVDENLICAGVNRSQIQQKLDADNSSTALCSITITEHACSSGTNLTQTHLASLLNCSLESQRTYPVEVWKLLFQKASPALDQALETFTTTASNNNSNRALSNALEALGEVRFASFGQEQLQSQDFISNWFQRRIKPFLASSSTNFLFCLSSYNFSCQTYQTTIKAFSNQRGFMETNRQRTVYTHFIKPFLSRNDSSDPGCVSSVNGSQGWLQANLGGFSDFATLQDLKALNPNFSITEILSELDPSQVAQLLLSSEKSNDTDLIDRVFDRLEDGNALENVDEFLTQINANGQNPEFTPVVRDRIMNRTFNIVGPKFKDFDKEDFEIWFQVKLVPILASFRPQMLRNATSGINCTNYHVVVGGIVNVFPAIPANRLQGLTDALLDYLRQSASVINTPECRKEIKSDEEWIQINLGPFSQYTEYSDLKVFNLSQVAIIDSLSSKEQANFLLESNNLSNQTLVSLVFTRLNVAPSLEKLESFFGTFVDGVAQLNLTTAVRDTILNLTLAALGPNLPKLNAEGFKLWFQVYLPLFLPSSDAQVFEVIPRNITCDSYQEIVKGFDNIFRQLSERQIQQVFNFTLDYLGQQSSSGLSCVQPDTDDRNWLKENFGQYRSKASFKDFVTLKNNFNGVDVADLLTLRQLGQLAATPSQLNGTQDVEKVMNVINSTDFAAFFDVVSPAIEAQSSSYTQEEKSAFLQAVLQRGNLSSAAVGDGDFLLWLEVRLRPLLVGLSPSLVGTLFSISSSRSCNSSQETMAALDRLQETLSNDTKEEINKQTVQFLKGPTPLKCYRGGSFYGFLRGSFLSFGFPDVPTFLSLLPPTRRSELINSFNTSDLSQFLSQPSVTRNSSDICVIFNVYNSTAAFVETEEVRDSVKVLILPCLWPLALSSSSRSEVGLWFDLRLKDYLRFLNKKLLGSSEVQNASCAAFRKLVFFMGNNFTYSSSELGRADVYRSIRSYLGNASTPRCYRPSDPELNSTAWFAEYVGLFITFITLEDLRAFVPTSNLTVFLEDPANLQLFSSTDVPEEVSGFYIQQLFLSSPSFSVMRLPGALLCSSDVPSLSYSSLSENDTVVILEKLKEFCNGTTNQEVSAALASNLGTVSAQTLASLGNASSGLSNGQIGSASPSVLLTSLPTLSSVSGWSQGQASIIVGVITAGGFQADRAPALASLGSLVAGLPAAAMQEVPASELLNVSRSPAFVSNMLTAPSVLQETFVKKIISVDASPVQVVQNVPDAMATHIPPRLLAFPGENADISVMNRKTWTSSQAAMFFGSLEKTDFDLDELSPSVLQGFTCTSVRKMTKPRIQRLVRACRPRKLRAKVELKEPQLTCMYNLLSSDLSQNFTDLPSDMLLYLKAKDVDRSSCRSYFAALGSADFSVASGMLNMGSKLFEEAKACLGLSGSALSRDQVELLGNMACTLEGPVIEGSDSLILEKLKTCSGLSEVQVSAAEKLLLSGNTKYGDPSTWERKTLEELENLPLYFTRDIWDKISFSVKKRFLKRFMPKLRKKKTQKKKLKALFKTMRPTRSKRGAGCTVGNITQLTVNDDSFPFGYDAAQFDLCLDLPVLRDNLDSICEKVDDDDLQRVVLKKLNQAFPSGVSDQEVQMLGSVSRVASLDDISKWNVTQIDTLAALMKTEDGTWDSAQSKEIITKYLNSSGSSLGSTELNIIDSNLCSLDTSTLRTISSDSIRNANPLNVGSCSTEQKKIFYEIANTSFSDQRGNPTSFYNLMSPYLGGASLVDVVAFSTQNINMDVDVFRSLDTNVIKDLTVANVGGLMGSHLPDLKLFENDTVVQSWVKSQLQADLDTLGIGLVGGRIASTTEAPANATTNGTSSMTPSPTNGTSSMTPSPTNGTSSMTPSPTNGTSSMTPSPTNGTSSTTPSPTNGTSSMTPSPTNGTSSMTPSPTNGTSPMIPSPTNGTSSMTPSPTNGTSSMTPSPTNGTSSTTASSSGSMSTTTQGTTSGGVELRTSPVSLHLAALLLSVLQMFH